MTNFSKLRDEHLRLMSTVRRLGTLIERKSAPPPLHVFTLRHELSSTLIAHLMVEDWDLYPLLFDSPDSDVAATARQFSEEMGGLALAYREHCEAWTANAIAGDWPGYCVACRQILDTLIIRITRENRELYPLIEKLRRAA